MPFEGATESHDIYREIKLKEAIDALQKHDYKKSLMFINDAKLYPQNLGVGKPYEQDIDNRLEHWLSYSNYSSMNNHAASNELNQIINFNASANNERNVQSSNALVTVWAYEKLNQKQTGIQWLNEQMQLHPEDNWLHWAKAILDNAADRSEMTANSNARILQYLLLKQ